MELEQSEILCDFDCIPYSSDKCVEKPTLVASFSTHTYNKLAEKGT